MADTRTKIIELATEIIMKSGFNNMSYSDISKRLHVKNAAIHYHFPTKEDLGVAVMRRQQEAVKELINGLRAKNATELVQLDALVQLYVNISQNKMICAIGSMGSDIVTLPKKVQTEVKGDYEQVLEWLSAILESGRAKRIFKFKGSSKIKAFMIFNNLISGVLVARFIKSISFEGAIQEIVAELKGNN